MASSSDSGSYDSNESADVQIRVFDRKPGNPGALGGRPPTLGGILTDTPPLPVPRAPPPPPSRMAYPLQPRATEATHSYVSAAYPGNTRPAPVINILPQEKVQVNVAPAPIIRPQVTVEPAPVVQNVTQLNLLPKPPPTPLPLVETRTPIVDTVNVWQDAGPAQTYFVDVFEENRARPSPGVHHYYGESNDPLDILAGHGFERKLKIQRLNYGRSGRVRRSRGVRHSSRRRSTVLNKVELQLDGGTVEIDQQQYGDFGASGRRKKRNRTPRN